MPHLACVVDRIKWAEKIRSGLRRLPLTYFTVLICAAVIFSSCGKNADQEEKSAALNEPGAGIFSPYGPSRIVVDSFRIDLDNDGIEEYVITTRDTAQTGDLSFQQEFDRIEFFTHDEATKKYYSIFVDPVENGVSASFQDLTGDGKTEVIVHIDAGGNDPISSKGLIIYGHRPDNKYHLLFYSLMGSPEIKDINGDSVPEILVSDEYWGMTSRSDVIGFISGIYSYNGVTFVESNINYESYFNRIIHLKKAEYERIKSAKYRVHEEYAAVLYRAFADLLVWTVSKRDRNQINKLWENEKRFLQSKLPVELYEDLESYFRELQERNNPRLEGGQAFS